VTTNNDLVRCFVLAKRLRDEAGNRRGGALDAYIRDQSYSALDLTAARLARKLGERVTGDAAIVLDEYAASYQARKRLGFRSILNLA
jgi:hypothetical protein